jgi:hypothetical protein
LYGTKAFISIVKKLGNALVNLANATELVNSISMRKGTRREVTPILMRANKKCFKVPSSRSNGAT